MKILKKNAVMEPRDWKTVVECTGYGHYSESRKPCFSTLEIGLSDICHVSYLKDRRLYEEYGYFCCNCHRFTAISKRDLPAQFRDCYFTPVVAEEPNCELSRYLTLDEKRKSDELRQYL